MDLNALWKMLSRLGLCSIDVLTCSASQSAAIISWPAVRPPSAKTTFMMLQYPSNYGRLCYHVNIYCSFIRREEHPTCSHSIQGFLPLMILVNKKKVLTHVKNRVCDLYAVIKVPEKPLSTVYSILFPALRYKG